jgi:hypothetical protein
MTRRVASSRIAALDRATRNQTNPADHYFATSGVPRSAVSPVGLVFVLTA